MSNSSLFADPVQTVHFLSVFNCINTLGDIFYNEGLLRKDEQFLSIPIINAFFEHLNQSNNETETKRNLVHRLLKGSDLYGGNENETLDIEYVNATFDYIISKVVFSRYGNVYGYLAEIVNLSNNLTLSSLKREIFHNLLNLKYFNEYASPSYLSYLAVVRLLETFVFPLFPQPKKDMKVIDFDYIYAQAGLTLARSAGLNLTNITFNYYITMSQTIELAALQNSIDQSALQIFTLPALLYYAYKEKEKFRQHKVAHLIKNDDLWSEVFHVLFSHLSETFEAIHQKALDTSPLYQFYLAVSKFKNRTSKAEEILHKDCPREKESDYGREIENYKSTSSWYRCPEGGALLPDLNKVYSAQVDEIKEKYRLLMKAFIREAFHKAGMIDLINSSSTTIWESQVFWKIIHSEDDIYQEPNLITLQPNICVFAIQNSGVDNFYAMVQNEGNITLLEYNRDYEKFLHELRVQNQFALKIEFRMAPFAGWLKRSNENFDIFEDRLASKKAKSFGTQLYESGYESTLREKIIDVLLMFVPFYYCETYAQAGKVVESTLSCIGDIVTFIPFAGQLTRVGIKFSSLAAQRLILATGASVRTITLRNVIHAALNLGVKESAAVLDGAIKKVIFTKEMFKHLSLSLIRSVDPGFELTGRLFRNGVMKIGELFKRIYEISVTKLSSLGMKLPNYRKIGKLITKKMGKPKDDIEMVSILKGQADGHQVFRNIFPGGVHPYGPKYVRLREGNAEMRRMVGFKTEMPVVVSRVNRWGKVYYKQINPKTGEKFGLELKLNENNLLAPVPLPFLQRITIIQREGLSGRGKLAKQQRAESIERATELVSKSNLNIDKEEAIRVMKQYILAVDPGPSQIGNVDKFEDMLDQYLNLLQNQFNPNTDQKEIESRWTIDQSGPSRIEPGPNLIGDRESMNVNPEPAMGDVNVKVEHPDVKIQYLDQGQLIMDPYLNQHLHVPTHNDFAAEWIKNERINDVYSNWRINNPEEMDKLLNDFQLDNLDVDVKYRIKKLYGEGYEELVDLYVDVILEEYVNNKGMKYVKFEDYYAIKNWIYKAYYVSGEDLRYVAKRRILNSFYKLAIRLSDKKWLHSEVLYRGELAVRTEIDREISQPLFKREKWMSTSLEEKVAHQFLQLPEGLDRQEDNMVSVLFEFHVDSGYLVADLFHVAPNDEKELVVLPFVKFYVDEKKMIKIRGHDVLHVKMHNIPIKKEIWMLHMIRKIEALEAEGTEFYYRSNPVV